MYFLKHVAEPDFLIVAGKKMWLYIFVSDPNIILDIFNNPI